MDEEEILRLVGFTTGGVVAGAVLYHVLAPEPPEAPPMPSGLGRVYRAKWEAKTLGALLIIVPGQGFVIEVPGMPEAFESPLFLNPQEATFWIDGEMRKRGYSPTGPWGETWTATVEAVERGVKRIQQPEREKITE